MSARTKRTVVALAALAYVLSLLACAPPGPQPPTAGATPVVQASPAASAPAATVGSATPMLAPTAAPSPTVPASPAPGPSAGRRGEPVEPSGQAWTDSTWGNPARTRYNPTALTLPLQPLWEWGDEETRRPAALVVLGNRLYVLTRQGDLYVLDAAGQELAHTTVWAGGGSGPVTLVATGDTVIACVLGVSGPAGYPARVVGLDRDGQRRWELDVPGDQRSCGTCNLLADGGQVVISAGDEPKLLTAYDAATGAERWRQVVSRTLNACPLASDGTSFYVAWRPDLVAHDWATGQERWRESYNRWIQRASFAAVSAGRLYVLPSEPGQGYILDAASGDVIKSLIGGAAQLAVAPELVYVVQSPGRWLFAQDAATGELRWQWTAPGWPPDQQWTPEGEHIVSVAACQSHVLVVTWNRNPAASQPASTLHLLDPATGQERGRLTLPDETGQLAVAGGRVYIRSNRLRAYGSAT